MPKKIAKYTYLTQQGNSGFIGAGSAFLYLLPFSKVLFERVSSILLAVEIINYLSFYCMSETRLESLDVYSHFMFKLKLWVIGITVIHFIVEEL